MLSVTISSDTLTPDLRRLVASITPDGPIGKILGRAAANALRKHFRALNAARPNKLGGKRSHFYSRVAESVQAPQAISGGLRIAISHPHIAQRLYGGTIKPRKKKAIAVPVNARAYGIMPRIYPGTLAFLPGKAGAIGYLVEGEERTVTRGKNKGNKRTVPKKGGALLYVLKGAITQRADKTVLPTAASMNDALTAAAKLLPPT